MKLFELKNLLIEKNFYLEYLMKKKLLSVKKLKIYLIVMLKGLQQKRPFRRR